MAQLAQVADVDIFEDDIANEKEDFRAPVGHDLSEIREAICQMEELIAISKELLKQQPVRAPTKQVQAANESTLSPESEHRDERDASALFRL